jgi:hypothetical protein
LETKLTASMLVMSDQRPSVASSRNLRRAGEGCEGGARGAKGCEVGPNDASCSSIPAGVQLENGCSWPSVWANLDFFFFCSSQICLSEIDFLTLG